MPERDLFANFDRMRREIDQLFGGTLSRTGITRGFSPAVDLVYTSEPPRAIVTAELAGVEIDDLELEVHGRRLVLAGRRRPATVEGDVYHQVEIERGPFRRVIDLGAEVHGERAKASYEDGMLRVELPLVAAHSRPRVVPIESAERQP
ncbi:MAG: Hsp20/alpha crystallin family protein [Solirubrobacteraceae bacterium]|jgi:HSP20 family protein